MGTNRVGTSISGSRIPGRLCRSWTIVNILQNNLRVPKFGTKNLLTIMERIKNLSRLLLLGCSNTLTALLSRWDLYPSHALATCLNLHKQVDTQTWHEHKTAQLNTIQQKLATLLKRKCWLSHIFVLFDKIMMRAARGITSLRSWRWTNTLTMQIGSKPWFFATTLWINNVRISKWGYLSTLFWSQWPYHLWSETASSSFENVKPSQTQVMIQCSDQLHAP